MFSVPVILIGLSDELTAAVKAELAGQSAELEAEYRSVDTAIEGLKGTRSKRRLLVVYVESELEAKLVHRLAQTLRGWPILALVETADQPGILLQVNRAGASQVVPLPLQVSDLRGALSCLAMQQHSSVEKCSVIAFTSSVAGCGATTLATNAAYEIATHRKQHTVLVELAQQMGVIGTNLDVVPTCTLADLLAEGVQVDSELVQRSLVHVADNFDILVGNQGVIQLNSFPLTGVLHILDLLRPLTEIIILDVPCTFTEFQFEMLGVADQVVVIGEQSISAIRTLKLMLDSLAHGADAAKTHVAINRYDPYLTGLTVENLARTLGVTKIHTIPDDRPGVLAAANDGKLLRQMSPHSPVLAAIDKLVEEVLGAKQGSEKSNGPHLFSRLFHAFRK